MSPFTIRVGKTTIQFRIDTLIVCGTLLVGGILCTITVNNRLKENARINIESNNANRRVLEDILDRMNDSQELVKQVREVAAKQRELQDKTADLFDKLQERSERRR